MSKETFKAGDEVYCPSIDTEIHPLIEGGFSEYPLAIKGIFDLTKDGFLHTFDIHPSIFHATPENKALLEALYKCEFESPKLKGSDLTRKLLNEGADAVLCYFSDESDEYAVYEGTARVVIDYESGLFVFQGTRVGWTYAVPCNDYANLVDGVLEVKK
ncbi:MAG: hypothetical protein H7Z73_12355 [Candidatus Saccharibacteria bacterium]|nr:hypothetical protein [Moraxellaceae bacterium]